MNQDEVVNSILDAHGFDSINETQEQAINEDVLDTSQNQLMIARTGSGKTFCAECYTKLFKEEENNQDKVVYVVPSVQLTKAKKEEIEEWYDGDVSVKDYEADIVVSTFESFYYKMINNKNVMNSVGLVILDDFHEIYSDSRGGTIEKVITLSKYYDKRIFALSATIGNPEELSDWMDANLVLEEREREVELAERFKEYDDKVEDIISFIHDNRDKSPFLIFNNSRNNAESRARRISDNLSKRNTNYKEELRGIVSGDLSPKLEELAELMRSGIAYHHAGLPMSVKEFIEEEFKEGRIKIISSTTTIGYGFDAPVRTVIVSDLKRYYGKRGYMDYVGVFEVVQWIGRAARPGHGIDEGYAMFFSKYPEEAKEKFGKEERELEDVTSKLENEFKKYIMELSDMGWGTEEEINSVVSETLLSYQASDGSTGIFSNESILKARVEETINELRDEDMLELKISDQSFNLTSKGSSIINFNYSTLNRYDLINIMSWYQFLEEGTKSPYTFVRGVCEVFDISVANEKIGNTSRVEKRISKLDLPDDEYSRSSSIILDWWCSNKSVDKIADETGYDTTGLYHNTRSIENIMRASKPFFKVDATKPEWFESMKERVKHGIQKEEVPFARIKGIGRYKVRNYRKWANRVASQNGIEAENLLEKSERIYEKAGKEKFVKSLSESDTSKGIGDKSARKIAELLEKPEVEEDRSTFESEVPDQTGNKKLSDF